MSLLTRVMVGLAGLIGCIAPVEADSIRPLRVEGENFVDPDGRVVRFWGMNLVALYPEHSVADRIAANLAHLQINLARPHHNLRPSKDWNPEMVSGSLLTYRGTSREFDPDALDRFDYLNAALRKQGIYLAMSMNWTRRYLPGDVDILKTDEADRAAWMAAMEELNGWHWKKAFDVYKMLPVVDERAALLNEEFNRKLLMHVNPYTNRTYAEEDQVLTYEVMNEASTEYAVICDNRMPEYWHRKLVARWEAYAKEAGIEPGDLYEPADTASRAVRAAFLRKLDADYFERMKRLLHESGSRAPVTYSNLWRGENNLAMHAQNADFIEAHMYGDPLVVRTADDWIAAVAKSAMDGKPFIIGELNQAEGEANIRQQSPYRSMLPLSASAYGSLHGWSGMVWFAWTHGNSPIAADGWGSPERRESNLGRMVNDGMMIDHLRTTGMIFRRGLVAASAEPVTLVVDAPYVTANYNELMRGKHTPGRGWHNVHGIRKSFDSHAPEKPRALKDVPQQPLVSDTRQIIKDIDRQQLVVAAPAVEALSGMLDGRSVGHLKHLTVTGSGFATVIVVAEDGEPLDRSSSLLLSRTALNTTNTETASTTVTLRGLKSGDWSIRITRPAGVDAQLLTSDASGVISLPADNWHECELRRR